MNNYKKYLLEESGNHLYRMKSKDTDSLWSNQSLTVNSVYISDFFEFYLKDLKITPKELMESSDSSKFIEIFYNVNYQKFEQRKEWIKNFENVIINDNNFFNESLKTCLSSHGDVLSNNYPESVKSHYLEENKQIFESLVRKGKDAGAFIHVKQEDLSTSYSLYKSILEKEGIFKSQFSFSNLLDSLKKNNIKENRFFQTYILDIIEFLENRPEKMQEISNNKDMLKNFVLQILTISDPSNYKNQSNFVSELVKINTHVREVINEEQKKIFYTNFPQLVSIYFNSLSHDENQNLFNDDNYRFNNSKLTDNYGFKATNWLAVLVSDAKNNPADFSIFDLVLKKQIEVGTNIPFEKINEFASRIQVAFLAKHIEHNEQKLQQGLAVKENEIINYLHEKMKDTAFIINPQNSYCSEDVANLQKVYKFIKEKDGASLNFIKEKIDLNAQCLLKVIFSDDSYYYDKTNYVSLLAQTIKSFDCPEVLKTMTTRSYPWELEINKKSSTKTGKAIFIPEPFAFTIIESTSPKTFEWFLQSPQLEELAKIKYKTKNIVEHLSKNSDFNEYLNILAENSQGFKKLVLENKKTLKKLSNSENENIKKTTVFIKMEDKLPPKETKYKPLKI